MLKFESVFWATQSKDKLIEKFESLGFKVSPSSRDSHTRGLFFGPESVEIFSKEDALSTLNDNQGLADFLTKGDGIFGIGLESDDIANDYRRLQKITTLEKPKRAKDGKNEIPLWTGFNIPGQFTPLLKAWAVMNSPEVLEGFSRETLPLTHSNTCFGIEGIHLVSSNAEITALGWAKLVEKQVSGVQWNELDKAPGKRIQSGERFFDVVTPKSGSSISKAAHAREGVFMLTLKVSDLELARSVCEKAGANPTKCHSRDGFMVGSEFTGGPSLRFVRSYWKRYMPAVSKNYPYGRRADGFRPLGGANSSTLREGFGDNWSY